MSRHRKGVVGSLPGPEFDVPPHRRTSRQKWLSDNREKIRQDQRRYRERNREKLAQQRRERDRLNRLEGIERYGGRCACCGESRPEFLTLDHIEGRGPGDTLRGPKAWTRLRRLGWPEGYQVLCFNCNCAKGIYGVCPHALDREEVMPR